MTLTETAPSMLLPVAPDVGLSATAAVLPEGLSWDRWGVLTGPLLAAAAGSMWWLGDLGVYAVEHLAERHDGHIVPRDRARITATLTAAVGVTAEQAVQAMEVSARFRPEARAAVSWSHHLAVLGVSDPLAGDLLAAAVTHRWTVREFRAEVRRATTPATEPLDGCDTPRRRRVTLPPAALPGVGVLERLWPEVRGRCDVEAAAAVDALLEALAAPS